MSIIGGYKDLVTASTGAWTCVKIRKHDVVKVFSCSDAADDLMMFGNLVIEMENGTMLDYDFAARVVIDDPTSKDPKLKFFEGWSVCINYLERLSLSWGRENGKCGSGRVWG